MAAICHAFTNFNIMSPPPTSCLSGLSEPIRSCEKKVKSDRCSRIISNTRGSMSGTYELSTMRFAKMGQAFSAAVGIEIFRARGPLPTSAPIIGALIFSRLVVVRTEDVRR